jgi:hypothetical protein
MQDSRYQLLLFSVEILRVQMHCYSLDRRVSLLDGVGILPVM